VPFPPEPDDIETRVTALTNARDLIAWRPVGPPPAWSTPTTTITGGGSTQSRPAAAVDVSDLLRVARFILTGADPWDD